MKKTPKGVFFLLEMEVWGISSFLSLILFLTLKDMIPLHRVLFLYILLATFTVSPAFAIGDIDPNQSSPEACVILSSNMRYRNSDATNNGEVSLLQEFLIAKGFMRTEASGYFGPLTFDAVKRYQTSSSLTSSGYVGPHTRAAIEKDSCQGAPQTSSLAPLSDVSMGQVPVFVSTPPVSSREPIGSIALVTACSIFYGQNSCLAGVSWSSSDYALTPSPALETCELSGNQCASATERYEGASGFKSFTLKNGVRRMAALWGYDHAGNLRKTDQITIVGQCATGLVWNGSKCMNSSSSSTTGATSNSPSASSATSGTSSGTPAGGTNTSVGGGTSANTSQTYSEPGFGGIQNTVPREVTYGWNFWGGPLLLQLGFSYSGYPTPSTPCNAANAGKTWYIDGEGATERVAKCIPSTESITASVPRTPDTLNYAPPRPSFANALVKVSNSPNGPWSGEVDKTKPIYIQISGLSRSHNPRSCINGSGGSHCTVATNHGEFTAAEWVNDTTAVRYVGPSIAGGYYDQYLSYPDSPAVYIGYVGAR